METQTRLYARQSRWETPKALAIIIATTAAVFGTLAGIAGYKLGSQPPQTINVHLDAPLIVQPAPSGGR